MIYIYFVWRLNTIIDPEDFKTFLSSIEPIIQFTLEMEQDRTLNFTDLTIMRLDKMFVIQVSRKDTHTNKYINWRSNAAMVTKRWLHEDTHFRAWVLCTEVEDREE